jgi:hypothetical protein
MSVTMVTMVTMISKARTLEFADELQDLDVQIRPSRTEQIALRLYKDDLEALKRMAKRRG